MIYFILVLIVCFLNVSSLFCCIAYSVGNNLNIHKFIPINLPNFYDSFMIALFFTNIMLIFISWIVLCTGIICLYNNTTFILVLINTLIPAMSAFCLRLLI